MEEIDDLIREAWERVEHRLEDEPALLAARLARRRRPVLMRPPRAWCIVVRASDRRIPYPEPVEESPSTIDDPPSTHSITLNAADLRELCGPVHVTGEFEDEAAAKLGTTPGGLTAARIAKVFATRHIPLLGGRPGGPIPLLTHDGPLDPNARHFAPADAAWSWTAGLITGRIPDDLCVALTRVPCFRGHTSKHAYDETRHPEIESAPPWRRSKRLPAPLVDPGCWYKWSRSGHYLGSDPSNWRKSFDDRGERPPRDLPRKRYDKPRVSTSKGSEHFHGYFWECPACRKQCRRLYYPHIKKPMVYEHMLATCRQEGVGNRHELAKKHKSPHAQPLSMWDRARERRAKVEALLLGGRSNEEISVELGVSERMVHEDLWKIFRAHGVVGRKGLGRKLGISPGKSGQAR